MARPLHAAEAGRIASMLERAWLTRNALSRSLWPLSWLFIAATSIRRAMLGLGIVSTVQLPVKVVVVGNLIAGGAGKTPTVLAVVALLERHGYTPGIVSRGYGRSSDAIVEVDANSTADDVGDEPIVLRRRAGVPVVVGADRVEAARRLLSQHPAVDVIVSDDGLQHARLRRDASVLVFDERGIGNGWRLPAGPLREAFASQPPACSVVIYNSAGPSTPWPGHLGARKLEAPVPLAAWQGRSSSVPTDWFAWQGRNVIAAAGVARPERFFDMLRTQGLMVAPMPLPDHFAFDTLPWPAHGIEVIVTEKDAAKLDAAQAGNARVWVAALDFVPDDAFGPALLELIGHGPASNDRMT